MVSRSVINFANRHKGIRNTLRKEVEDGHKTGRYNNERCALMIKNIDGHYIEKFLAHIYHWLNVELAKRN